MPTLDTNIIIRQLTQDNAPQHLRANAFFHDLAHGNTTAHLPEGVLVECVQVLESKNLYNTPREQIRTWLAVLLRYPSLKTAYKRVYLRALERYATIRQLSFVDCLCVAHAERRDGTVMTFDTEFRRAGSITRIEP